MDEFTNPEKLRAAMEASRKEQAATDKLPDTGDWINEDLKLIESIVTLAGLDFYKVLAIIHVYLKGRKQP